MLTACTPLQAKEWQLIAVNGQPVPYHATLRLDAQGISGQAPCNSYAAAWAGNGTQVGAVRATRRACPDLAAENAFFQALSQMERATAVDAHLVLTAATGGEMLFAPKAAP